MALIALGLNHQTAPVALRERIAFPADATPPALTELIAEPGVSEAAILSTCNRTELYCTVAPGAEHVPGEWLNRHHLLTRARVDEFLYRHADADAVRHLFRVVDGYAHPVIVARQRTLRARGGIGGAQMHAVRLPPPGFRVRAVHQHARAGFTAGLQYLPQGLVQAGGCRSVGPARFAQLDQPQAAVQLRGGPRWWWAGREGTCR